MENEIGSSMRKAVSPEQLAEIMKELDALPDDITTLSCIRPDELVSIAEGEFPHDFTAEDFLELLSHVAECKWCGPVARVALPKILSRFLKKRDVLRFLNELNRHFSPDQG